MNCQYCGTHWETSRRICWDGANGCGAVLGTGETDTPELNIDVQAILPCPGIFEVGRSYRGGISAADLVNMMEHLTPTDNAAWFLSRTTYPTLVNDFANWSRNRAPYYECFPRDALRRYEFLFGMPLVWSRTCSIVGYPGDAALVDWTVYHAAHNWPQEPEYVDGYYCRSPFVVLGQ